MILEGPNSSSLVPTGRSALFTVVHGRRTRHNRHKSKQGKEIQTCYRDESAMGLGPREMVQVSACGGFQRLTRQL